MRETMPEVASTISKLPWVEHGVDRVEYNAFRGLIRLSEAGYLAQLIAESWVVEGRNYPALESLWSLVINNPKELSNIMSNPTISDGITDQEAKIIATLHSVIDYPDLLDKLLDPQQVTLEERTITLPLAGETDLTIIRTSPGVEATMDSLEHSIRSIEEFMAFPFPQQQVIILLTQIPGWPAGLNYGTHLSISVDEQTQTEEWMLRLLAHEMGHHYLTGSPRWMSEGGAHFMVALAGNALDGALISEPCALARNISGLEDLINSSSPPAGYEWCSYSLGERLFRDLYRNVDETTFRQAFRRLYLQTVFNIYDDECADHPKSICHVEEAFSAYATEEAARAIETVIARWHDGTEPYDSSWMQRVPVEPDIPAIDGRIEGSYLSYSIDGPSVSTVPAEPNRKRKLFLNLDYSYQPSKRLYYLPIEIAIYYEDGFEIGRIDYDIPVLITGTRSTHYFPIYFEKALGRYWVHAYLGEQKIAETTFETIPPPDPYNIRGVISDTEGQPLEGVMVDAIRGGEEFSTRPTSDGAFSIVASSGTFILEVWVPTGFELLFVGWYDGSGVTTDPTQAFEVVIDDADVEGIEIVLPADTSSLLCSSGLRRSNITGECGS